LDEKDNTNYTMRVNRPRWESESDRGEQARRRTSQKVNQPGSEKARGERARGQI